MSSWLLTRHTEMHNQRNKVLTLCDNYPLLPTAATPPRVWAGDVNTLNYPTGRDNRYLSDKIMAYVYPLQKRGLSLFWNAVSVSHVYHWPFGCNGGGNVFKKSYDFFPSFMSRCVLQGCREQLGNFDRCWKAAIRHLRPKAPWTLRTWLRLYPDF